MLAAAEAVNAAMEIMEPHLVKAGVEPKGKMVLATVHGDLHDIGKNIVALMLQGAGFEVIDLGSDVPAERIVASIQEENANLVGLSALLTTTMRVMKDVVDRLEEKGLRSQVKVLIGGAPTSPEFARDIGADAHGKDAFQAVEIAEELSKGG
jgi:5-methyltetrahydrofolate--homocysteine methyltransferase